MLNYIRDFLKSLCIQVRVGGSFSDTVSVNNGTTQESVISPVLFNIMVNMFEGVGNGFGGSLFADDGAIWKRGHRGAVESKIGFKLCCKIKKLWGSSSIRLFAGRVLGVW